MKKLVQVEYTMNGNKMAAYSRRYQIDAPNEETLINMAIQRFNQDHELNCRIESVYIVEGAKIISQFEDMLEAFHNSSLIFTDDDAATIEAAIAFIRLMT